MKSVDNDSL
ncbi:Protein of unknown function [Bacillus cereus]|nr:Protein of unknown function [Bacillus cereus]